ncbi:Ubn2_3 domain-containing protein, partial [Thalictrum thalictroides]
MAENTSSTSSLPITPPTPTPPSPPTILQTTQIHHLISVKLDTKNYLLWLTQFKPLLKGYDLQGYVDGTLPCPPRHLSLTDSTINPAYLQWHKQDQ